jgi:hypothetical protein
MKLGMSMGKFEAELDSDVCDQYNNANLILTMKLGFRQINPAGNAASGTYHDYGNPTKSTRKIIKWTVGSWELWKKNFVSSAQNYWHGKFWLVNNFDLYTYEKNGVKYRPNIWCGFNGVYGQYQTAVQAKHR